MGTHPIFESDFDCLTVLECQTEALEQTPKGILGTLPETAGITITTMTTDRTIRQKVPTSTTLLLEDLTVAITTTIRAKHHPVSITGTPTLAEPADCSGSCRISSKFNTSLLL